MFKSKSFLKMQELSMVIVNKKALVTFHLDRFAILMSVSAHFFFRLTSKRLKVLSRNELSEC